MLREEFVKACEMRADGCTYQEIANCLGYTKQHIHQTMNVMLRNDGYKISSKTIYPNLEREIKMKYRNSTEFSKKSGFKYKRICDILYGKTRVLLEEALWFREHFNKDIDYLFKVKTLTEDF